MKAIDYSARLPGSAVKNAGFTEVFRYLGDPNIWPKAMTRNEVIDLWQNGIRIRLNYEQTADFMLSGYSGGKSFSAEARKWANFLGFSVDEPIIYSADFDATDSQVSVILEFLQGAADSDGGINNVNVYGGFKVVNAALDRGYAAWQTEAWSYGKIDPRIMAYQSGTITINGVQCDLNTLINATQGGTTMSTPIPQSIRDKWGPIASQFQGTYDDSTAIIWADAGARYAAYMTDQIMAKLNTMTPTQGTTLTPGDIDAIANAVIKKMGTKLGV